MTSIKKISVLSIIVIISFLCVCCDHNNEESMTYETYTNAYYTIQYPSYWLTFEVDDTVVFSKADNPFVMTVRAARSHGSYFQESIDAIKENMKAEACIVGGNKGYKFEGEEDDNVSYTFYYVQEKDMYFEIKFEYHVDDDYKSLMDHIINTFAFNDFATVDALNRSPKVNGNRDARWLADIEFVLEKLPQYHKNLFFKQAEEKFLAHGNRIKDNISSRTDHELIVEISRWIAAIGDSHTSFVFNSEGLYPFRFYYFSDGVYLVNSSPEYQAYIGLKLKGINEKSVADLIKLFRPVISHENESWFKMKFANYIVLTEVLNGLNITQSQRANFIFMDKNGHEKNVEVKPTQSKIQHRIADKSEKMLYLKNTNENYWYEFLEEEKLVYFQYNRCENMKEISFSDFNEELFNFIDNHSIQKLVVDLRHNVGGSSYILDPFFAELKKRKSLDQSNQLFVIIGRNTYSSATLNAVTFKNETNATFIGEPTGGKPNHYGQVQIMELSNTNTKLPYSTKYFTPSREDTDSFMPDILVEPNADDYFNNMDSAMVRILDINE